MKKTKSAFTLIELLVVIAIIGLLATLSVVALNNARAKARDAKRVSDIKQIQTALELYYNDVMSYPPDEMVVPSNTNGIYNSSTSDVYMQVIPAPPTPPVEHLAYTYAAQDDQASYTLEYFLEGTVGSISAGLNTATNASLYEVPLP